MTPDSNYKAIANEEAEVLLEKYVLKIYVCLFNL